MKTLVAFYSRTGTTKKVGDMIAEKIDAEVEEIKDTVERSGTMGYIRSGRDAMKKRLTKLESLKRNLSDYDLIVVGTPIWGWNMSAPVRTFLTEQKDNLKEVAFFCTMGGSGDKQAFAEMEKIIGKKPHGTLAVTTKNAIANNFSETLAKFLEEINRS